jgi:hypothetical protein
MTERAREVLLEEGKSITLLYSRTRTVEIPFFFFFLLLFD